jgi:hypothetical protein
MSGSVIDVVRTLLESSPLLALFLAIATAGPLFFRKSAIVL